MRYTTRIIVPPRIRRSGPPGSPGGAYGPQALGVRKTFGFGDRLGVATPAHVAVATAHPDFAPVFAQQSPQEMTATQRTAADVVGTAARGVSAARFRQPWGADADRLKTAQEVVAATEAGFTFFTFDASELVRREVDQLAPAALQAAVDTLVAEGDLPDHWAEPYLDRTIDLPGGHRLLITLEPLQRAVVRYVPAVAHCARLSSALARSNQGRPFEIEVALDGVDAPASTLEHLFIGLELEARGVRLTGLALTHAYVTPGARDQRAEDEFKRGLREHAAVAEFCGPYKLCFHEVANPATAYPIIGRVCGEALHVKTSGESYLEALRVVAQIDPPLFDEIARDSVQAVLADPALCQPGFTVEEIGSLRQLSGDEDPLRLLDHAAGRRCLDATCGAILGAGQRVDGQPFKRAILELLGQHADLYAQFLSVRFDEQIGWLNAG